MSVSAILENVKKSHISKLTYNGKVVGFRATAYDVDNRRFNYYDFDIDVIGAHKGLRTFMDSIQKSMNTIKLIDHNNLLISEMELNEGITIQEFKDTAQAVRVLEPIVNVYKYKGVI